MAAVRTESLGRRIGRWSAYGILASCMAIAVSAPFLRTAAPPQRQVPSSPNASTPVQRS